MRSMWKGFVSFGLVTIPVRLYAALAASEEIRFHLLHAVDKGKIRYKRVCERCGEEVAWAEIEKGFEYAKDEYVPITDEDFEKADVGASQTIDIVDFAGADEIDPKYFEAPYYLEPQKGSERPYALLREALGRTARVGVAKVVLRTRERLACVKPDGDVLIVELMRFADEVRPPRELALPPAALARARELELAEKLIDQMTVPFDITKYRDEYKQKLEEIIREKVQGIEPAARGEAPQPTRVIDLMAVLERSLAEKEKAGPARRAPARHPAPAPEAKKAAGRRKTRSQRKVG